MMRQPLVAMARHRITRGLRLPIAGEPSGPVEDARPARHVALLAADYVGLRPTMHVSVGDTVARGQILFEQKTMPGVTSSSAAATVLGTHVQTGHGLLRRRRR